MDAWLRESAVWLIALALLPAASFGDELPEWTRAIRTEHPRLFFNADTWPEVRDRALGAERQWYQRVKDGTDRMLSRLESVDKPEPQELGPQAAAAAFVFLMTEQPEYLDLARKCLTTSLDYYDQCFLQKKTVNWYSTSRVHAVMAWDWLYNHMSESDRRATMSRLVGAIDNVLKAKPSIYRENMSGYATGFYGVRNCLWFIGCTAFGTGIETERVNQWLVWGHDENRKMLEHRKRACGDDGGGASPTLGYVFGAYPWSEQNFFYTWLSATGENIAPNWPHGAWLTNYVIWNWIDAEPVPLQFGYGDTPHTDNRLPAGQLYTHMANIQHLYHRSAPQAAALARHIQTRLPSQRYSGRWFIYPFLLSDADPASPPLALESLPYARHFDAMGQIFMRSGTDSDDTYCLFTCGGILRQHRHFDALNFVIYRRGFLALDSGTRYDEFANGQHLANYFAQTVAHNCVVIHQPGEPAARYWGGQVEGNHGGQHRQLGSVVKAFESTDEYVYVAGDATACYEHGVIHREGQPDLPEKCGLVTRQLVFLVPRHFVVFDRVTTTDPSYQKDWLIHTVRAPQIDDRTIRADHDEGRMFCRTLLPGDAALTAVGGPGKEFWAAGKNWTIQQGNLNAAQLAMMGQWRVEVTPSVPRQEDFFLHVIQVGDRRMELMDETRLIQADERCGVRLTVEDLVWEICFDKDGDLGGQIRRTGGVRQIDVEMTSDVQPQSGIMANAE
jgi:heparin/heparan-sulfate lyase